MFDYVVIRSSEDGADVCFSLPHVKAEVSFKAVNALGKAFISPSGEP